MASIHQFVAGFAKGDAISNEALALRGYFRSWGLQSEIFCESNRILPELRREAHDVSAFQAQCSPDDVVVNHLSIGSVVNEVFQSLPCAKAIIYHNVTPPHYFRLIQPQTARALEWGIAQRKALAPVADVNIAVSEYNAAELRRDGYVDVRVVPLVLDFSATQAPVNRSVMRQFNDGLTNVLSVGRVAPNKKIEDSLLAFHCYQRAVNPNARFIHVGSYAGTEPYYHVLLTLRQRLKIRNVYFTGSIPLDHLTACYRSADLFICMSEHEGVCIPLLEAMVHDLPVLAYAAAAVPETLDGCGVLVKEKNHEAIAEMMGSITNDESLRKKILVRQRRRLDHYRSRDIEGELRDILLPLTSNRAAMAQ